MSQEPVICFGQQPCGFLPRRFLFAKFQTARRLQAEMGGRIVFFYHDSDHDPRETQTTVKDLTTGATQCFNFTFANKIQKKYSPLYAKRVDRAWQASLARQLPKYLKAEYVPAFEAIQAENVADFCLEMYQALGLLEGIEVVRSSDPSFREQGCEIDDFFVDVTYENELVRARYDAEHGLRLHRGGSSYLDLPAQEWQRAQVSPCRDTRLRWMQSVIKCTHYVAGAGEMNYLDTSEAPDIEFIKRDEISDSSDAYLP
ncbi:hypothetical protein ACWPKS_05465 [Coraliomargarita sp. W4R72]